jgi:hypothetical protein
MLFLQWVIIPDRGVTTTIGTYHKGSDCLSIGLTYITFPREMQGYRKHTVLETVSEILFLLRLTECSVPYSRLFLCLVGHKLNTPDRTSRGTSVQLYVGKLRPRLVLDVTQHDNYFNFFSDLQSIFYV